MSTTDNLRELLSNRWAEPAMAWTRFLINCPPGMTVEELVIQIAKLAQLAECRHCNRDIQSYDGKSWHHLQGGYRQCDSVDGTPSWERTYPSSKAAPEKGTVHKPFGSWAEDREERT